MIQDWGEKCCKAPTRTDVALEWAAVAVAVPSIVMQIAFVAGALTNAIR